MNLYEIDSRIMEAFESAVDMETGEIVDGEAYKHFDDLQMQFDKKVEGILLWIKDLNAEAEALKKEKQAFEARQKAAENKVTSLKNYVSGALKGEKFKTDRVAVSYRKSTSVELTGDIYSVPEDYLRYKEPEIRKDKIKEAIKAGAGIPGVQLVEKISMQIR